MKNKYKIKFQEFVFRNKWKEKRWGDFVLIGISKFNFSYKEFEWIFSFFGFELRLWFEKVYFH